MQPIPITRAEYQAKFGVTPPPATSSQPIPITRAEYEAKFGTPAQATPKPFRFDVQESQADKIKRYQEEATQAQNEAKKATSVGGFLKNVVTAPAVEMLPFVGGAVALSKTVNKIVDNPATRESQNIETLTTQNLNLLNHIKDLEKQGKDTTTLKKIYNSNSDSIEKSNRSIDEYLGNLPTQGQAAGQLLHTGLDVLSAGTYGKATSGMQTGTIAPKIRPSLLPQAKLTAPSSLFSKATGVKALQGAAETLPYGYGYDVALGLEGQRGEDRTGANAFIPGAGTAIAPVLGAVSPLYGGAKESILIRRADQAKRMAAELDRLVTQVSQGKIKDIPRVTRALSEIDTAGARSYGDVKVRLNETVEDLSTALNSQLDNIPGQHKLNTTVTSATSGNQTVKINHIKNAIDDLEALYARTNDAQGLAGIKNLRNKATKEGLTVREMNDLAKQYGDEMGQKAFSKSGEPLTSATAESVENTRSGIKIFARDKSGAFKDIYTELDGKMSDLIRTRELMGKMEQAVATLKSKIQPRTVGQQIGRVIGQLTDLVTAGGAKGFLQYFIGRGAGLKTLDALDLEKILIKNIDKIQSIIKRASTIPEAELINELRGIFPKGYQESKIPSQTQRTIPNTVKNSQIENKIPINQSNIKTNRTTAIPTNTSNSIIDSTIPQKKGIIERAVDKYKETPGKQAKTSVL